MTQPFRYGANYGGENTSAFSTAFARGAAAKNSLLDAEEKRRKMDEEDSNRNALNTMALMEQPEYQAAMQDPSNRNTLMADRGVTPVQQQAIQEQRTQKIMAKYTGPAFSLQQQYNRFVDSEGSREKAIAKMQPLWEPWYQQATADGLKVPQTFNPEVTMGFLTQAHQLGLLKDETLKELGYLRADTAEKIADKKAKEKEASKGTQKERERDEFVAEYKDQYPGLKRVHIAQAEKLVQKEGMPFAEALSEVMAGVKEREYPSGLKTSGGGAQYPTWAFGGGGGGAKGGAATSGEKPPSGAKDTGRTSGGKKVWQLPNGKYWVPSR